MKIVGDEGLERPIVTRLRADGHHVIYVAEIAPGSFDPAVLGKANQEGALLVTADKDFGDLVFRQGQKTLGMVLLRLPDELSSLEKATLVSDVIKMEGEKLFGAFTVITVNKVRIIRLPPPSAS